MSISGTTSLPDAFIKQLSSTLPEAELLLEALKSDALTSIRYNTRKNLPDDIARHIPWCNAGQYLKERPIFTLDPLLHAGGYYVQEASSMFLEQAILQLNLDKQPLKVLDACASPGGKSTHLLSLLHPESLLVANETIKTRQAALVENVIKWGHDNVIVTNNDVSAIGELTHFFDVIVCDAPCSGEGLFRKDKEAVNHWSLENVELCSARQKRIVHDLWMALKPGGFFIYSTCTYNEKENEDNVLKFLKELDAECTPLNSSEFEGVMESKKENAICYRFYPHKIKGEGFALSVLRKNDGEIIKSRARNNSRFSLLDNKTRNSITDYVASSEQKLFLRHEANIFFIPTSLEKDLAMLSGALRIIHAGTAIGEIKRDDVIPSHELALSLNINRNKFQVIDVDKQTALHILKGQTQFNFDADNGYCLITYSQIPFAFLKKIGNRFNNLYPKNWYIRMQI